MEGVKNEMDNSRSKLKVKNLKELRKYLFSSWDEEWEKLVEELKRLNLIKE